MSINMATRRVSLLRNALFIGNFQQSRCIQLQNKILCSSHIKHIGQPRHTTLGLPALCSIQQYSTFGSSVTQPTDEIRVEVENGLPLLYVPLPSRKEVCQFTLRPISHSLGDLTRFIREEDPGVDRLAAFTEDGHRIAKSTPIDILLQKDFHLVINDQTYYVKPSQLENSLAQSSESLSELSDVKNTISRLYSTMNIQQHQIEREQELLQRLHDIQAELQPMEKLRTELEARAKKRTNNLAWLGLGLMGFQFGLLARLTWFEYSWDIMEPVTYFVTYGTSMAMFAYYVLTKKDYNFCDVADREYLLSLHKGAQKLNMDLSRYNVLRDELSQAQVDLDRLRDPLQLQLPIAQLLPKVSPPASSR